MLAWFLQSRPLIVYIAPFILGGVSILGFQPFNFTLINFITLPCLFLLLGFVRKKSVSTYRKRPFLKNFFIIGYFFGIGFFLFGNYWISNSLTFDENLKFLVPISFFSIPLYFGLFYGIACLIIGPYIKNNISSLFYFCAILAFFDFIRGKILPGFPWNFWAYSWSWFTEILQILNFIGLFAFNFLVIFLFTLPSIIFLKNVNSKLILSFAILTFFFTYVFGSFEINKNVKNISSQDKINVKIISPSLPLKYGANDEEVIELAQKLVRYSEPKKNLETLFIWPEGVFAGKYLSELDVVKKIFSKNFSDKHTIIFGVNTKSKDSEKIFNSFVAVNNKFEVLYKYDKNKLVPFGEYLPLEELATKIGLKKITFGYQSFSEGLNIGNMNYKDWMIKPSICYEIIFTEIYQKSNLDNSFIVNISEDVWFGKSIGPYQHFTKSIFRAVETNSFVIRSANRGISSFISNKGQIIKSLQPDEVGSIEFDVPKIKKKHQNKNDLIFFILLITSIIIFIFLRKHEK